MESAKQNVNVIASEMCNDVAFIIVRFTNIHI